nr:hypothetical protein [uncultured Blautia sp.]
MKKKSIKEFFRQKKAAAGCVAAAVIIAAGSFGISWQSQDAVVFPSYTDPVLETSLTGDDTPLASKPKVTTKKKTSTKTTSKKVRMRTASRKSYTKKLPTKQKSSTKTTKQNKSTTVKTQTVVKTATTEKYTRRSKQKLVTQKVTTTVTTTTTVAASTQAATGTASTSSESKYTVTNIASAAPKMDNRVLNAFTKLGFVVKVDSSVSYSGHFDARTGTITMKKMDETIYHELGHFLSFIADYADESAEFVSIYNSEKSKVTGYNKAYVTQNAAEYFAESVKDYVLNPGSLQSQRPKTYKAVVNALSKVTANQIEMYKSFY